MHLIILGPQGSGKGTQATRIAELFGLAFFSMGDALRSEAKAQTQLGAQIKKILDKGELVPSELTNKIIAKFIRASLQGFIIDGYPRSMEQAQFLDMTTHVDAVLVLDVSDDTSVERLSGRRTCPHGHIYHVKYHPPKKEGVCDEDGLPLAQRSDDTEAAIRKRLAIYHETTRQVLDHYRDRVIRVNGEGSIVQVHQEIVKRLKKIAKP
jgi:adenylate kinase